MALGFAGLVLAAIFVTLAVLGIRLSRKYGRLYPATTTGESRPVVLYDGDCVFCTKQVENFKKMLGAEIATTVSFESFQDPAVLARFPGLTHEAAMEGMVVIEENGKVSVGMAAVAALMSRRTGLARAYFLPGVKQIADGVYALIAMNRYRLMGKAVAAGECENGSCQLHFAKKP